ncbi:hypothetical protein KC19_4G187100 [Ceratodon purpureus]|uniref:Uncharacterized protein n=1 Tax=Ceratodon purpureus TaxID=3225 RepID=A0A8T0G5D3_CERPU|nr:hypothetical protein KC19_12G029300 [Ceratodon purpureus]KAG0580616.1 hypothetical protein KC19_4G187100 [Ceratodon purpureus]
MKTVVVGERYVVIWLKAASVHCIISIKFGDAAIVARGSEVDVGWHGILWIAEFGADECKRFLRLCYVPSCFNLIVQGYEGSW